MRLHRDSNSQNGSPLGSVWTHSFPLFFIPKNVNVTLELHFRLAPFQTIALVTSRKLKPWQETMEYLNAINLCYGKQETQELQGHVSNAHTWTICKVVAKLCFVLWNNVFLIKPKNFTYFLMPWMLHFQ